MKVAKNNFFQKEFSHPLYKVSYISIDPDGRNQAGNFNLARAAKSTARKDRSLGTRAASSFKSAGRNWKRAGQISTRRSCRLSSPYHPRRFQDRSDRINVDQRRRSKDAAISPPSRLILIRPLLRPLFPLGATRDCSFNLSTSAEPIARLEREVE